MIACSRKGCTRDNVSAPVMADDYPYCSQECADQDKERRQKYPKLHLDINPDRIMEELNLQCAGYLYLNFTLEEAQKKSLAALKCYIGERKISTIKVEKPNWMSPADIAMGDYGFRLES